MSKTLGLDLGTNSIGWAIVDKEKSEIIRMGSRIFPEGVMNLGDGEGREISKNAGRTENRGARRQFFRRRLRKRHLLRELSKNNLCPVPFSSVKIWTNKEVFNHDEFKDWIKLNPYELRSKGINEEITLHELGRILYHMIQRRGFLSNSRSAGSDEKENSVIFKGNDEGKIGISSTLENIEEGKTLGSYLNSIQPKENKPFEDNLERIRNRYTTRQMYIDEFEKLWEVQSKFHPELTNELKTILGGRRKDNYEKDGVLFHQRPLRSQKHLVGNCTFEPNKTKALISAIPFEEFRVYQWVNTVECNGEKLNEKDRETIVNQLFSKEKVKFMALRRALKKNDNTYQFNYKDDDAIVGSHAISNFSNKKFFGPAWFDLNEKQKEDIWHVIYFFDDKEKLTKYAKEKWGFDDEKAVKIADFNLKEGYSSLSIKAINNILPFLKKGFIYDIAVALGGVKNAFGENWNKLSESELDFIETNVPEIVRTKIKGGYIEELKRVLSHEFHLSDKQLKKLYHHSSSISTSEILDSLPLGTDADKEIQSIKNPVVITALFELRRLVNELIDEYGSFDTIKVEMARDLKISKSKRNDIRREQKRLEKENDRVKNELINLKQRITHDSILKYKLWEECNNTCPFTGKKIPVEKLFSGEVQIEHIFPWSRSLNDSFMNKTLCFADENRAKGNKTPFEFYSAQSSEKWEEVKTRALDCFKNKKGYPNAYAKFKQFVKTKHDSDFVSRQLNDTRYISKEAKNYLGKICKDVQVSPGQATAKLRHFWGMNGILNDDNAKSREDHRHHAVDALVMACTERKFLMEMSKWNTYNRNSSLTNFPLPWDNFINEAHDKVEEILVSHRRMKNIITRRTHTVEKNGKKYANLGVAARGQLHKETVFGRRQSPNAEEAFHVRKPIETIVTEKHLNKVVDPNIRTLIMKRVNELGGIVKGKLPEGTFFTTDENGHKKSMIYLPNKNGAPVPIKKVRMKENIGGAAQLKENKNQYVNPRNNHHVLIYENEQGELREDVVTFWEVAERKRQGMETYKLPADGVNVITTLHINDMFLLGLKEDQINWNSINKNALNNHLYRVQKFTSKDYYFRKHFESNLDGVLGDAFQYIKSFGDGKTSWKNFNPIKVKISSTGKVEKY